LVVASSRLRRAMVEEIGDRSIEMTLQLCAHVLPSTQQDAAARLASMLH